MPDVEPGIFIPLWAVWKTTQILAFGGAAWLGWFLRGRHERRLRATKLVESAPVADIKAKQAVRA